ncbi:MAG: hypothetical protein K2K57_07470, partial [Oscillospiraceae bacterium]|nr:hypothetical protein [Oscillospiraceae bacterium]
VPWRGSGGGTPLALTAHFKPKHFKSTPENRRPTTGKGVKQTNVIQAMVTNTNRPTSCCRP